MISEHQLLQFTYLRIIRMGSGKKGIASSGTKPCTYPLLLLSALCPENCMIQSGKSLSSLSSQVLMDFWEQQQQPYLLDLALCLSWGCARVEVIKIEKKTARTLCLIPIPRDSENNFSDVYSLIVSNF